MRRLTAGLAAFGMLWGLAGCVGPPRQAAPPAGQAATAGGGPPGGDGQAARPPPQRPAPRPRRLLPAHLPGTALPGPRVAPGALHRAVAAAAVGELLGA